MFNSYCLAIAMSLLILSGCDKDEETRMKKPGALPVHYSLSIDKSSYNPGELVTITVSPAISGTVRARYKYLNVTLEDQMVSGNSWTWQPPRDDYRGYMMELYTVKDNNDYFVAAIAIDVSSNWFRFPRYGFLSKFPDLSDAAIRDVISNLNRHHINGIQFYDWHYKHHQPLAGTPQNPVLVYRDIINREIYFNTVKKYIDEGHKHNMKAMFYNLVYGALNDASAAGVKDEWYVFTDNSHSNKDKHPLSSPFISDIYITDPSNVEWQEYLAKENRKVYDALPFDGFHMDQLGYRGTRYRYNGNVVDLAKTYKPFIEAMKQDAPSKYIALNAVDQYGQDEIAKSPVDFLYTEVWGPNTYAELANVILDNDNLSNHSLKTVLAAYMNYDLANNTGHFNTPGVLLTNAVIFSFGGSHLELGEHMLGKEYFPNNNLEMRDDLKRSLVSYYDFLVAYQNLLRDGGLWNNPAVISSDNRVQYNNWPPQAGKVSVVGKDFDTKQVIHLLNFNNAKTMQWRDNNGTQGVPVSIENVRVRINTTKPVGKVWYASPDFDKGASYEVEFATAGNQISFTIPWLQYWDMIVIEYQ